MSWAGPCPAPPCLVLRQGLPLSIFLQHWVRWQRPLVSGTPGGTPGSRDCWLGVWGRGQAGVQGRIFLTRRAKDRVVPYPRSHPCARPPHPALPGSLLLFLLPPLPCAALSCMVPPTPRQPGRSTNGESLTNAKKTVGGPLCLPWPPLFPTGQATCHVRVECQHRPRCGPNPPCPGP